MILEIISEVNKATFENYQEKWEYLKYQIAQKTREYSIEFGLRKKRQRIDQLQNEIVKYDAALTVSPGSLELEIEREILVSDLQQLLETKAREALFRSRYKWATEGEKSTKFFFNIEKERYLKKAMIMIRKEETNEIIVDREGVLNEQVNFYQKLYSKDPKVEFELTNDTNIRINENWKLKLDEPISLNEIHDAVFQLKIDKTPGLDGIPPEFYRTFWSKLGESLLVLFEESIQKKELNHTARRGCITLIPKKSRDSLLLRNWRPITLLNSDYKILAKVIANRIKQVLPDLISSDQTGFMENRQITTTIRKTMEICCYDAPGYLINLDFEKCFDKIDYSAIIGSLRYFGFGEYLISLVQLLLTNFWSCTINDGYTSNYFRIDRSCH